MDSSSEENQLLRLCSKLSLGMTATEMLVISKWLYKYKNMQRRDKAYQKLNRVNKDFKRYYNYNIHQEIVTFAKQLEHFSELDSELRKSDFHTHINDLSSKVSDCIKYIQTYLAFIESTFSDLLQRIDIGHNIPIYIVATASLSRIWVLVKLHAVYLDEALYCIQSVLSRQQSINDKKQQNYHQCSEESLELPDHHHQPLPNVCQYSSSVILDSDMVKQRQDDFSKRYTNTEKDESLQPTTTDLQPIINEPKGKLTSRQRLKKHLNTVNIVIYKNHKKSVLKIYNSKLARRVHARHRRYGQHQLVCVLRSLGYRHWRLKVVHLRTTRRRRRSRLLKQQLIKKRQYKKHQDIDRLTQHNGDTSSQPQVLLKNMTEGKGTGGVLNSNNSIDDIFSLIEVK